MKLPTYNTTTILCFFSVLAFFSTRVPAPTLAQKKEQKQVLIARFEVTKGADDMKNVSRPRHAILLYSNNREVKVVRISGKNKTSSELGTFASFRLLHRLERLNLPKIDYQKHFDRLKKLPPKKGKDYWISADGKEVEVEMTVKGTKVRFKMWNPGTFFYNHEDDKIAKSVNEAVEAIIVTLGKSAVYF